MKEMDGDDTWLNLPLMMQQFADKQFAQYQLDVFQAKQLFDKGQLKQSKLDAVFKNGMRPLILMHTSGEPAGPRYVREHLTKADDGTSKLKVLCLNQMCVLQCFVFSQRSDSYLQSFGALIFLEKMTVTCSHDLKIHSDVAIFFTFQDGSRATLVLFDFVSKQINIGCLGWVPLRVLQAETKLDAIHLELDKEFLQTMGDVPGMEHYGSEPEDASEKAESEKEEADENLQLEANGMIVAVPELDLALASLMETEGYTGNDEEPDQDDIYTMGLVSMDDDAHDSIEVAVSIDEHGNLIACPEIELVINQDLMIKSPEQGGISVRGVAISSI